MGDEERDGRRLPLRSLHDFLFEIEAEWNSFRTGSMLSVVTTLLIFLVFIPRFQHMLRGTPFEKIFAIGIVAMLLYSAYTSWRQHQFYQKWEKRLGLLLHLEEELLGGEE